MQAACRTVPVVWKTRCFSQTKRRPPYRRKRGVMGYQLLFAPGCRGKLPIKRSNIKTCRVLQHDARPDRTAHVAFVFCSFRPPCAAAASVPAWLSRGPTTSAATTTMAAAALVFRASTRALRAWTTTTSRSALSTRATRSTCRTRSATSKTTGPSAVSAAFWLIGVLRRRLCVWRKHRTSRNDTRLEPDELHTM